MTEILSPLGKYKCHTWSILPVKCYINIFVHLWSCIWNVNKHFWCHCWGGSQYLLFVYRIHGIILISILSLTDLFAALCLFMVFTGSCMSRFNLPANYHSDLRSLIRKSSSWLSSPVSSRSHVWDIVDKLQGSPPPHNPHWWLPRGVSMISKLRPVPTSGLFQRWTSEMAVLNLN
jgi:hypothetical protein